MKILCVTHTLDVRSGWGRYSASVVDEFSKLKIEYEVLAEEKSQYTSETILPSTSLFAFFENMLLVRKKAKSVDIVHVFEGWPLALYGYAAVWGTGKPLFVSTHGTYSIPRPTQSIKGKLLAYTYRKAEAVFCNSEYTRNQILSGESKANAYTVLMGTSPITIPTKNDEAKYGKKYQFASKSSPIILTVGAIKNRKGQLDTLKAVAILKKKFPDILYLAVGALDNSGYADQIKKFSEKEVLEDNFRIITDAKSDAELGYLYSKCDIFALSSNNEHGHFEGFGLVFLEANQFGKPGVGSRDCGIESAIEDGYSGMLSRQGDAEDIADKIERIVTGDKEKYAIQAKEFATRFDWGKTVSTYVEAYKKALADHDRP